MKTAVADQTKYLRLVETLGDFRGRLRARADTLDVPERQKILRLLVKEVLVGRDTITIRHSIRISTSGLDPNLDPRPPHHPPQQPTPAAGTCYLLRSGSNSAGAGQVVRLFIRLGLKPISCRR
jgi:site-specific DNA recombinase